MMLDELEQAARRVLERSSRSVVGIGRDGRGSGFVLEDGLVATNAHNLRGAETTVRFPDGRAATGTVVAADVDGDLGVVAVDTGDSPPLAWSEAAGTVKPGAVVFALAGGRPGPRLSFGLVSSEQETFRGPRGRVIAGGIEHTAPLPRGASGGPVLDREGRLVAINTHRVSDGLYLALPADAALRARLGALAEGQAPQRRRLGVLLAPAGIARRLRRSVGLPDAPGLLVRAVEDNSVAASAGLREGDLLQRAGQVDLETSDDLHRALDGLEPGAPLPLTVLRGVEHVEVTVLFDDGGGDGGDGGDGAGNEV